MTDAPFRCTQTFPFQKDALEFATWCADAPAADLRYMLSQADQVPYRERYVFICVWGGKRQGGGSVYVLVGYV